MSAPQSQTIHYRPNQRAAEGWISSWRTMIRDCIRSRDLIFQLFKRDYLMLYKKSFLGMGWHLAAPIMGILSWVLMNSTGILDPGDVGIPYPAYVLISTAIWGFFMQSYNNMSKVLDIAQGFVHQVGFPHHVLIAKQWMETLAGFSLTLIVMIVGIAVLGVFPSLLAIFFPLALIPIMLLGSSIGLIIAVIKVVSPDLQRAATFVMGFWMYITPVIYSPDVDNPLLQTVIKWNPMTYLLIGARDLFVYNRLQDPLAFGLVSLLSIAVFLIVWRVFYVSEEKVIEKMI